MPLKKKMFRFNLMVLISAIILIMLLCGIIAVFFEDILERDFISLGKDQILSKHQFVVKIGQSYPIIFVVAFLMMIAAVLTLFFVSFLFSRRMNYMIMEPLTELIKGAERIQNENLTEDIVYHGEKEFENLCQTFNDMQRKILYDRERRKQDEKARIDMVTGISHDLRTPLTSIQGYIKGVLDGIANTEEKRRLYLTTAYESTVDMNILLQKLFDFSRLESGQMPFHFIQGDLVEYVQMYFAQKEEFLKERNVTIHFSPDSEKLFEISMDIDQLRRIFDNLLENSIKYTESEDILIDLCIFCKESNIFLEWKDYGPGVAQDKIDKIFDRFYRCDESRNKKGSGVGLYVVQSIMKQHGGYVQARNEYGLVITLAFPMEDSNEKDTNCRG